MKKLGAVVITVMVLVGAVLTWKWTTDDDESAARKVTAVLDDYWAAEVSVAFSYPEWWTDGQGLVRFGELAGSLTVLSLPSGRRGIEERQRELSGGDQIKPQALASTAGRPGGPFVAVGYREVANDAKNQPIQAWVDQFSGPEGKAVAPQQLPVDVDPVKSSDDIITVDAAIGATATNQRSFAVVQVNQHGRLPQLVGCEIAPDDGDGACAWQQVTGPGAGGYVRLGATSDGVIAVTDEERPTIWYATDASLNWKEVGRAPRGFRQVDVVDGADQATLIWRRDDNVALQTVSPRGNVRTAVKSSKVPGEPGVLTSAFETDEGWYLGGAVPADPQALTSFKPRSAGLWVTEDDTWQQIDDPLLVYQVDQPVVGLWTDDRGRLSFVTTSSALDVTMFWRLTSSDGPH